MVALDDAFRFGGLVLAHAAWILSETKPNELLCPIAVIVRDDKREVIAFEAPNQAEAVENGKASFEYFKQEVQFWSLAREGFLSLPDLPKQDVITVSSWTPGLDEPVLLYQAFSPTSQGKFLLVGHTRVAVHGLVVTDTFSSKLLDSVWEGIAQHSHGYLWQSWFS